MICNLVGVLIFLSVCGVVVSNPAIDCRKFVFAPLCRGVAAKRGNLINGRFEPDFIINEKSIKELLKGLAELGIGADEELEDNINYKHGKSINKQDVAENSIKKYQHEKDNRFYRFLLENKRINSDADGTPIREYENV